MTPKFISGRQAKSALKPADVRGAALPSPKTATSVARPGGVPSVPIGAAGAGTPGESSQGIGLNPHDRQELPRLSKSTRQTEAKKTLPRAIRQKTLNDVQRVVRAALGRDRSVVRLKLSPPELGRLTIDMRMENDTLHLKFEADSPRVRALLLSSSGLLSNSLAEAGVVVERYEVLLSADASDRAGFEAGLTEHDAPDDSPQDASDGSSARLNGAEAISPEDTLADELGDEQRTGLKAGLDVKA